MAAWSPASMGDYVAGPNHVLPTNRTARFASALRADDFRKHVHAVHVTPDALRALGPHVVTLAEAEGLPAHADSVRRRLPGARRRSGCVSAVPPVRPDLLLSRGLSLASGRGRGAAQHERVAARRRPRRGARSCWPRSRTSRSTAIPTGRPPSSVRPSPDCTGSAPRRSSAPTGPTKSCSASCWPLAAPAARPLLFEPTYALHSHIARITGTAVVEGGRDDDFQIDPDDAVALARRARPDITFLCSPNNPTGRAEPPATTAAVCGAAPGLVIVDEAYGQFAPWSALELHGPAHPGLVVTRTFSKTWAMAGRPPRLPGGRSRCRGRMRIGRPALSPLRADAAGRAARPAPRARDGSTRRQHHRGAGPASPPRWPTCRWTRGPPDANFILFRPRERDADEVWRSLLSQSVLIRNCASWEGLRGCLRVTIGTPEENDRFLHALKESL